MTRLITRLIVGLVLSVLLFAEQVTIAIRKNGVKARQEHSRFAPVLATLQKDESFVVRDDVPNWFQIRLRNRKLAWIPKSQTTVLDNDEEEVDTIPSLPSIAFGEEITVANCTPITISADFGICPATGSGGTLAAAYQQKNRLTIPCSYKRITPDTVLNLPLLPRTVRSQPDDDPGLMFLRAAEAQPVVLEGFLAMTKNGGKEGVNCGIAGRFDLRVEIVDHDTTDPRLTRSTHIVTEATPWFRGTFAGWTPAGIGPFASYTNGFGGTMDRPPVRVRIYGFLFFDEAHLGDLNKPANERIRGTVWEVHPITRIEVQENNNWRTIE